MPIEDRFPVSWRLGHRGRRPAGRPRPPRRRFRPALMLLEDRIALTTFWVTTAANPISTNDPESIPGSLSYAIYQADQQGGSNTIDFDIESGPQTIDVSGTLLFGTDNPEPFLPAITCSLTIDGTTQPGYSGTPLIAVNGQNAFHDYNQSIPGFGLEVESPAFAMYGLDIQGFSDAAVYLAPGSSGARIQGDYIGTDLTGEHVVANAIGVEDDSQGDNTIGGTTAADRNVISANTTADININGFDSDSPSGVSSGNLIEGNFLGTNAEGTASLGSNASIDLLDSNFNTIGGTTAAARNVIDGGQEVILFDGSDNLVEGNYISTNAAGSAALPQSGSVEAIRIYGGADDTVGGTTAGARNLISGNATDNNVGVLVDSTSDDLIEGNYIGTDATGEGLTTQSGGSGIAISEATDVTVGGTAAGSGNVISGWAKNSGGGISISDSSAIAIEGNEIGTDASGEAPLGNHGDGIVIVGTTDTTIGGTTAAARNVISANGGDGIDFEPSNSGIAVEGNEIGTDASGTRAMGNASDGIYMQGLSGLVVACSIGGTGGGAANIIAFNSSGIGIATGGRDDPILSNSIYSNAVAGINLYGVGNDDQPAPNLTSATVDPTTGLTSLTGSLQAASGTTFLVQFFSNPTSPPQGQTYVGSATVTTGSSGQVTFTTSLPLGLTAGHYLTATATDPNGNTSQFSDAFLAPVADVSAQVGYSRSGLVYNRKTGLFTGTITLTDIGTSDLLGPLEIVFAGLTPGVTLANASGSYEGNPYLTADFGMLAPGQSVTITLSFRVATLGQLINYEPIFYLGSF